MLEVELFKVMAYEPEDETDATLGFNLIVNAGIMDAIGKDTTMMIVKQALSAMNENFYAVGLDEPAITVDVV